MTSWQPLKALAGAGSVVMLEDMNDRHEQNGQAVAVLQYQQGPSLPNVHEDTEIGYHPEPT